MQSLVSRELQKEFAEPSEEFVRMLAGKVYDGRLTSAIKDSFRPIIVNSIAALIRDRVNERLANALIASNPAEDGDATEAEGAEIVVTTEEEMAGFHIIRAIASKIISPKRIVLRDAKSYAAVILDDNNRKTIARLHFNSPTARYFGAFLGKDETRHRIAEPVEIYRYDEAILARIAELVS